MKKYLLLLGILFSAVFADAQYRYTVVPEGGGPYQVPNKEQLTVAYAASIALSPTHEETFVNVGTLTGALTLTVAVTDPVTTLDRLHIVFKANGSNRVVTFSTGFAANGTLTVQANSYASAVFIFDGVSWVEQTRQIGTVNTGLFGAGTAAAPSISFSAQTDLGLYKVSSTELGVAAGGSKVVGISTTGASVTGTLSASSDFAINTNKFNVTASSGNTTVAGTLGVTGVSTFTAPIVRKNISTAFTGNASVTAAQLAGGLLTITSGTDTLTLPTASALATQLGATAGTIFDFVLINTAAGGTALIVVNTGITASGFPGTNTLSLDNSATIGVATFRITFISTSVATITRIS